MTERQCAISACGVTCFAPGRAVHCDPDRTRARVGARRAGQRLAGAALLGPLLLVVASAPAPAQDAIALTPRFENGRRTYIEQVSRTTRRYHRPGATQPLEARSSLTCGMLAVVAAAEGQTATIRLAVDRVALADESPDRPTRFDTDVPSAGPPAGPEAAGRALLTKSVEMRVARGQCEPNSEQLTALRSAAAAVAGRDPAAAVLLDEFSPERFRYGWGDARQALFAWRDVRTGETWENTLRQTAPDGAVTIYEYRCKLDAIEKRDGRAIARVSFSGEIRADGEPRPNDQGVTMRLDSGRFHGTALFDVERREFTTQDTVAELRATATTPPDAAGKRQTIRLEQSIESRTTIAPAESRSKGK